MAEVTKIQWTTSTFNPWRGCTKVSEGCRFCYAEKQSKRNPGTLGMWGPQGTRVLASESKWREPLAWEKEQAVRVREYGSITPPWLVFCASLADVFENWPGQMTDARSNPLWAHPPGCACCNDMHGCPYTLQDARQRLWDLIRDTPHLTWQLLTKRPENVRGMVPAYWLAHWPANVWIGTSVEDQEAADERIPHLLRVPAHVRFLSAEPLLGPVHLPIDDLVSGRIRWVIIGGESGPHARPFEIAWGRSIIQQCQAAGTAVFMKQVGNHACYEHDEALLRYRTKDPKGGDPDEWPTDLRVRDFPA